MINIFYEKRNQNNPIVKAYRKNQATHDDFRVPAFAWDFTKDDVPVDQ